MSTDALLLDHVGNPIVWGILALALFCFILQFDLLLARRDAEWQRKVAVWLRVLPVLLGALPLLGLLGTIVGLLSTFRNMAVSGGLDQQTLMSSGIATALVTTQLGLFMVIPGLVLFAMVRRRFRQVTWT